MVSKYNYFSTVYDKCFNVELNSNPKPGNSKHKFDLILINNLLGNKYPFNNNVYTIDEQN